MSGTEETRVRAMLARAADELPAGGLSAETLLVAGDRAVRRRRRFATATVAAVAAVVLVGSAVLLGGGRPGLTPADDPDRSPAASHSAAPSPTATPTAVRSAPVSTRGGAPTVAPARFDPTRRLFRLGWTPPEAVHQVSETGHAILSATAHVPDPLVPGGPVEPGPMMGLARSVIVRMGAKGVDILAEQSGSPMVAELGTPVAPIDGNPAFLYVEGNETQLFWEYAPGGWISVTMVDFPDAEEVGRRVAAGLTWESQRVGVPFRPVRLPARATLAGTRLRTWDGRWFEATAHYRVPGGAGGVTGWDFGVGVSDGVYAGDGSDFGRSRIEVMGRAAETVDGSKGTGAWRVAEMPGCGSCVAEVDSQSPGGFTALGEREGALALAVSVRTVTDPADPGSWRPL